MLTPTEYRLLAYLARHASHIVPQDALLEQIWGKEIMVQHETRCFYPFH